MIFSNPRLTYGLCCLTLMTLFTAKFVTAGTVDKPELPTFTLQKSFTDKVKQPAAVDMDSTNRVYILNGNNKVQVFSANGDWLFAFGQDKNHQLNGAMDLKIFNDEVYIADTNNSNIAIYSLQGKFNRTISTHFHHEKTSAPTALAIDEYSISFSDRKHHRVCQLTKAINQTKYPSKQSELMSCFGSKGNKKNQFNFPFQLVKNKRGYQYIVDVLNGRVQVVNRFSKNPRQVSRFGLQKGELYRPNGITIDKQQRLYISDAYLGDISVFKDGKYLGLAQGLAHFNSPNSLRWLNNDLWVVDYRANTVYQYQLVENKTNHTKTKTLFKEHSYQQKHIANLSQKECVSCHISWQVDVSANISKITNKAILPVASQKMCDSCHHGVVIDSRAAIAGYQHPSIADNIATNNSAKPTSAAELNNKHSVDIEKRQDKLSPHFPLTEQKQLSCASCHTPHNADKVKYTLYKEHKNNWLRIDNNKQEICIQCHQSETKGANAANNKLLKKQSSLLSQGQNHPIKVLLTKIDQQTKQVNNKLVQTSIEKLQTGLPQILRHHGASLDAKQQLQCQSCHQIHGGFTDKLLTGQQNQFCDSCHEQQSANSTKQARSKGIHPVNITLENPIEFNDKKVTQLTCQTCHSPHDGSKNTALLANAVSSAQAQCVQCHKKADSKSLEHANEHNIHPVNIKLDKQMKVAGKDIDQINCLTCHSVHEGKANTAALVAPITNGELCQSCHQAQSNIINTDHDLRITAKQAKNALAENAHQSGVCGSCHTMHQGKKGQLSLSAITPPKNNHYQQSEQLAGDMLCLNCHQQEMAGKRKTLTKFSHPKKDMILRSTDKKMSLVNKQNKVSEFGQIACKTCHDPHNWQAKNFESLPKSTVNLIFKTNSKNIEGDSHNSFLTKKGVKGSFCVDCHRNETLYKYRYYHDKRSEQPNLDYLK